MINPIYIAVIILVFFFFFLFLRREPDLIDHECRE